MSMFQFLRVILKSIFPAKKSNLYKVIAQLRNDERNTKVARYLDKTSKHNGVCPVCNKFKQSYPLCHVKQVVNVKTITVFPQDAQRTKIKKPEDEGAGLQRAPNKSGANDRYQRKPKCQHPARACSEGDGKKQKEQDTSP